MSGRDVNVENKLLKSPGAVTQHDTIMAHEFEVSRLRQAAAVFQVMSEGIFIATHDGLILDVNSALMKMLGYKREDIVSDMPFEWLPVKQNEAFHDVLRNGLSETAVWHGEVWLRHKNGELHPAWLTLKAVPDRCEQLGTVVGVFAGKCHGVRLKQCMEQLARYEPLTKLYNRHALIESFNHALERAAASHRSVGLFLVNLDRFKDINDALGHSAGDFVLISVAERIQRHFGMTAMVASMGGDEFALVLENVSAVAELDVVASQVVNVLREPHYVGQHSLHVSPSIGISVYPRDGLVANDLIDRAKNALVEAKRAWHDKWCFYRQEMSSDARGRFKLEGVLRRAIESGDGLELHYQPQFELETGAVIGLEALVRWTIPDEGPIPTARFIALAERYNYIDDLGEWVLREACRQLAVWQTSGLTVGTVAINLSARQFHTYDLISRILSCLDEYKIPPGLLGFEITETAIAPKHEVVAASLQQLRSLGCSVAIDDFGTGYVKLHYLQHFPADILKIDMSFVSGLPHNEGNAALVRTIITLAHNFGLKALAEGVETEEQRNYLEAYGCDYVQGFLFGNPMCASDLEAWMKKQSRSS